MSELLDLTAAQAAEGVRTGTVDHGELWTAYRERALADEPRPSLPREVVLDAAPDPAPDGFRVPSPGAAPV